MLKSKVNTRKDKSKRKSRQGNGGKKRTNRGNRIGKICAKRGLMEEGGE